MSRRGAVVAKDGYDPSEIEFGFHTEDPEPVEDQRHKFTIAGPVTVTKDDGSVEIRPAYSPEELEVIVR
jgi:hypothetical protein